jgi:protein tyrosine/serine phosphatase
MPPSDLRDLIERPKKEIVQAGLNAMARCKATNTGCFEGCLHGQDRTGLLTALYRWLGGELSRDAAWAEALRHGFHRELHELADVWEDWPQ